MVRPDLRPYMRSVIDKAREDGQRQVMRDLAVRSDVGEQTIDLIADPLEENSVLIVFQDIGAFRHATEDEVAKPRAVVQGGQTEQIRVLEEELDQTRDQLRTTIEELETSNEELKSSNEEMMSMNEELQATNEELTTVNDEMKIKVDEIASANNDFQNFLQSTQIATVFVDKSFRVRNFTPAVVDLFGLRAHDRGRPLLEVKAKFGLESLEADMQRVLSTLSPIERDVEVIEDERQFVLRILPYRTLNDVIDGVVLTFHEMTKFKALQSELEISHSRYASAVKASGHLLFDLEPISGDALFAGAVSDVTGYLEEELKGGLPRLLEIVAPEDRDKVSSYMKEMPSNGEFVDLAFRIIRKDGESRFCEARGTLFDAGGGRPLRLIGFIRDINDRVELEQAQQQLMYELQHRVKNTLATVQSLVRRTASTQADKDSFARAITDRIDALARTHNLLTASAWRGASLRKIVEDETKPYVGDAPGDVVVEGEDVSLTPRMALAMTMAVHELVTNASKYGALSRPGGQLKIDWCKTGRNGSGRIEIDWLEQGGPRIDKAPGSGFGRTLLERGVAVDLGGEIKLNFRPEGLHCRIIAEIEPDIQPLSLSL